MWDQRKVAVTAITRQPCIGSTAGGWFSVATKHPGCSCAQTKQWQKLQGAVVARALTSAAATWAACCPVPAGMQPRLMHWGGWGSVEALCRPPLDVLEQPFPGSRLYIALLLDALAGALGRGASSVCHNHAKRVWSFGISGSAVVS
jgi:hypothetical protein